MKAKAVKAKVVKAKTAGAEAEVKVKAAEAVKVAMNAIEVMAAVWWKRRRRRCRGGE